MKYVALSVVLFLAGLGLTQLRVKEPEEIPVVRLRTHDGFFVTLVQDATDDPRRCEARVARLKDAMTSSCPDCDIDSSACTTKLAGVEGALARGEPLPLYTVTSPAVRMAILGPPGAVQGWCETVAREMVAHGVREATCLVPQRVAAAR